MIPLAALPAIVGGVQALSGAIGGLLNKRPKYQTPDSQNQSLALAQLQASGNMPSYNQTNANIGTATGNALVAARESGNPLAAIGMIQGNENKAINDLGMANSQYQDQKQEQLQMALKQNADYQDQAWQINEFSPYADKKSQFNDMLGAGMKNVVGGLDSMNMLSQLKGGGGGQGDAMQVNGGGNGYTTPVLPMSTLPKNLKSGAWQTPYLPASRAAKPSLLSFLKK